MKYYKYVIDPANANMNHWQLHKSKGFTFILPATDMNFDNANYSILYHEHKKEKIVIISPSPMAQHGQQLNVLFRYLKLPKETKHLDCLLGIHFLGYENIGWGRTVAPDPKSILYDISDKKLIHPKELTPKELLLTTYIEKTFNNYLSYARRIYESHEKGKTIKFKIEEIILKPVLKKRTEQEIKIKLPQKIKIKKPIRRI